MLLVTYLFNYEVQIKIIDKFKMAPFYLFFFIKNKLFRLSSYSILNSSKLLLFVNILVKANGRAVMNPYLTY